MSNPNEEPFAATPPLEQPKPSMEILTTSHTEDSDIPTEQKEREGVEAKQNTEDQMTANEVRERIGLPPHPVESVENAEVTGDPELLKQREEFLTNLRQIIDRTTDRLGLPIEPNIKNPVVMLNAFGLQTSQSCEGHPDKWSRGAPWVGIKPEITFEEARKNPEKREQLKAEVEALRSKSIQLLTEFYKGRDIQYDAMLLPVNMGFEISLQSVGLEQFNSLPDEERERLLPIYQKEMNDFADYLRAKFMKEGVVPKNSEDVAAEGIEAGHSSNETPVPWEGYVDPRDALMEGIKNFEITGDPQQDAIRLDEIDNNGRLKNALESGRIDSLRHLVVLREDYRKRIDQFAGQNNEDQPRDAAGRLVGAVGYWQEAAPEVIALIDKILDHYGVEEQTMEEFDYAEAGKEGSRLVEMLIALGDFKASGSIRKDVLELSKIINQSWQEKNLDNGIHPVKILLMIKDANLRAMEKGPQSNHLGETKRLIAEVMPVQNEVINKMLEYYQVTARSEEEWNKLQK